MNELIKKESIEDMIYEIRGKQVMLDSDLAKLYEVETKYLNRQVKRNIERFPEDFCFQLTKDEYYEILRCQNVTLELKQGQFSKYLPYVFTETGVSMLASVLHSETAVNMSIKIIRVFVAMRHYLKKDLSRISNIETKVIEHDNRIKVVEDIFDNFKEKNNYLFFKDESYDAYSVFLDILGKSKEEIIIIDNYIDKSILDILKAVNKQIIIITNKYNNRDYKKYKEQYHNIKLKIDDSFHDRFIVIDRKELYHSGSSFKDLGKKCFQILKIDDNDILNRLLDKIEV